MSQAAIQTVRDEWTPAFLDYQRRWDDYSDPFHQVRQIIAESVDAAYKSEGRSTPAPWPPRKGAYSWPMLRQTGRMYAGQMAAIQAVPYYHTAGEHELDFTPVATATPITHFHFYGAPGANLPQRRTFNPTDAERERMQTILSDHTLKLP